MNNAISEQRRKEAEMLADAYEEASPEVQRDIRVLLGLEAGDREAIIRKSEALKNEEAE